MSTKSQAMNIQEISVSNNLRKKLGHCIKDENIVQVDENGDVIVNVEAYQEYKNENHKTPIEDILADQVLDFSCEFFFFS